MADIHFFPCEMIKAPNFSIIVLQILAVYPRLNRGTSNSKYIRALTMLGSVYLLGGLVIHKIWHFLSTSARLSVIMFHVEERKPEKELRQLTYLTENEFSKRGKSFKLFASKSSWHPSESDNMRGITSRLHRCRITHVEIPRNSWHWSRDHFSPFL